MAGADDPLVRLASIRLDDAALNDFAAAERLEWWLANGRGGYAGGTVALSLSRRYHGLLIAPVYPPLGRVLVLAKADATLRRGEVAEPLFSNRWASGAIVPEGHRRLVGFELDGTIPVWHFACGGGRIVEQRIWMEPGADTVYAAWRLAGADGASLSIAFLANGRDHHGDTREGDFTPYVAVVATHLDVTAADFALHITATGDAHIEPRSEWYENFDLPIERERALNDRDAHRHVGDGIVPLQRDGWAGFVASLDPQASADLDAALARRRAADRAVLVRAITADPVFAEAPGWVLRLVLASDLYLIRRPLPGQPDGCSMIAGYPWFGDWGRDTMIALPGICLATGRFDEARRILETFAACVDGGMLPNLFPGTGALPEYNTVDAALWYVAAWRAYVAASGDDAALRRAFPVLRSIIDYYRAGTRYGIAVDPGDGLVRAGEPGVQVTWMDARVGDWVVTPRIGKPVEVNALWFNALIAMTEMAARLGEPEAEYADAAARARAGFARFVLPDGQGLYDVLDGPDGDDASLRPNQLLAVSLPKSPLDPVLQHALVARVAGALVTPFGLRSLASDDPRYRGVYSGGPAERDAAYHQGTVWAWLLGHFALAHHRVTGDAAAAQALLEPIGGHLCTAGLGQVSEIFDGDPPHTPRGCPAQAWSVGCVLEAWWRLEHARRGG